MGVLRNSTAWATNTVARTSKSAGNFVRKDLERVAEILIGYRDMILRQLAKLPKPQFRWVSALIETISDLIERILKLQPVSWCKENLYHLYHKLWITMENAASFLAEKTIPVFQTIIILLRNASLTVQYYVMFTFDKIDDRAVTPCCNLVYDISSAAKHGLIKPAIDTVNGVVVKPVVNTAGCLASTVKSTTVSAAALVDRKLSLVDMIMTLVRASQKVDQCITSGAIEYRVVRPIVSTAEKVDSMVIGGRGKSLCVDTLEEFHVRRSTRPPTTITSGDVHGIQGTAQRIGKKKF